MTPKSHPPRFEITRNSLMGCIDCEGNVVIEPVFDAIYPFEDGLASFEAKGRRGVLNTDGDEVFVLDPSIEELSIEKGGLFPYRVGELWGYLGPDFGVVIPPRYRAAEPFREGFAIVKRGRQEIMIDAQGNERCSLQGLTPCGWLSEGLLPVKVQGKRKIGFLAPTGSLIIPAWFRWAESFSGGRAAVSIKAPGSIKACGFINRSGDFAVPPIYEYVLPFSEGLAAVQPERVDISADEIGYFGFIDPSGHMVIAPQFDSVADFSEGLAMASSRKSLRQYPKVGYIDRDGNFAIKPRFHCGFDFRGTLARVQFNRGSGYGYINHQGDFVWQSAKVWKS